VGAAELREPAVHTHPLQSPPLKLLDGGQQGREVVPYYLTAYFGCGCTGETKTRREHGTLIRRCLNIEIMRRDVKVPAERPLCEWVEAPRMRARGSRSLCKFGAARHERSGGARSAAAKVRRLRLLSLVPS
jgi:hypothetical protein